MEASVSGKKKGDKEDKADSKKVRWIFWGMESGLYAYRCSNCGYVKTIMWKPAKNNARCIRCGSLAYFE